LQQNPPQSPSPGGQFFWQLEPFQVEPSAHAQAEPFHTMVAGQH
jgi:hypothetical protein